MIVVKSILLLLLVSTVVCLTHPNFLFKGCNKAEQENLLDTQYMFSALSIGDYLYFISTYNGPPKIARWLVSNNSEVVLEDSEVLYNISLPYYVSSREYVSLYPSPKTFIDHSEILYVHGKRSPPLSSCHRVNFATGKRSSCYPDAPTLNNEIQTDKYGNNYTNIQFSGYINQYPWFIESSRQVITPCQCNGIGEFNTGKTCEICKLGHYCTNQTMYPCPQMTYNSEKGSSSPLSCLPCPENHFTIEEGSYQCYECPIETRLNNGSCQDCPPGTVACIPCPLGSYSSVHTDSSCTLCPYGYSTNSTNIEDCFPCPKGTAYWENTCSKCGIGYYSDNPFEYCQSCLTALNEGSSTCPEQLDTIHNVYVQAYAYEQQYAGEPRRSRIQVLPSNIVEQPYLTEKENVVRPMLISHYGVVRIIASTWSEKAVPFTFYRHEESNDYLPVSPKFTKEGNSWIYRDPGSFDITFLKVTFIPYNLGKPRITAGLTLEGTWSDHSDEYESDIYTFYRSNNGYWRYISYRFGYTTTYYFKFNLVNVTLHSMGEGAKDLIAGMLLMHNYEYRSQDGIQSSSETVKTPFVLWPIENDYLLEIRGSDHKCSDCTVTPNDDNDQNGQVSQSISRFSYMSSFTRMLLTLVSFTLLIFAL